MGLLPANLAAPIIAAGLRVCLSLLVWRSRMLPALSRFARLSCTGIIPRVRSRASVGVGGTDGLFPLWETHTELEEIIPEFGRTRG